jgi:VanZ family protein
LSDASHDENGARRPTGRRRALLLLAWGLALFIVFATWGPQSTRPHLASAALERFGAYFAVAALFVAAYPGRPWTIAAAAVAFAVTLEFGQFFAVGRDPGVRDAVQKALGGVCGVMAAAAAARLERRGRESADA